MRNHLRIGFVIAIIVLFSQGFHLYSANAALPRGDFQVTSESIEQFREVFRAQLPTARDIGPVKKDPRREGIELSAPSAIVVDAETGKVLFSKGQNAVRPIASITKLMTALVLLDMKLDWSKPVTLGEADRPALGTYYLEPGDVVTRGELLKLSLGASANNATAALVRTSGVTREEFLKRMNAKAEALGMQATFLDTIGLNPGTVSNAVGVQKLLRAAMQKPEIRNATKTAQVKIQLANGKPYKADSTNELLGTFLDRAPYAIVGGKTGFIDEAGYCLAQTVRFQGHDVDVIVLGAREHVLRFSEVKALAVWSFDVWNWGN